MSERRNFFIRSVAAVSGDVAIGYAMASACVWVIQYAALGLFLSFMLWIMAVALALALSQNALHPAVELLLSDRKLDAAVTALSDLAHGVGHFGAGAGAPVWDYLRRGLDRFATDRAA